MRACLLGIALVGCGGSDINPLTGDSAGGGMDSTSGSDGNMTTDSGVLDSPAMDDVADARMDMGIVVSPIGCSDGTREAFTNMGTHPNIAGCSGGFSVAGVTTQNSMSPQCNRVSGNSSGNTSGNGCSVEDLCAAGWHVCATSAEVQSHSGTGMCDTLSMLSSTNIWITRQSADNAGDCIANGHNNILGCQLGNTGGLAPGQNCAPLDSEMWYGQCANFAPWQCGNGAMPLIEADVVTKGGSDHGGVICCKL
jgi:hypothetical protein